MGPFEHTAVKRARTLVTQPPQGCNDGVGYFLVRDRIAASIVLFQPDSSAIESVRHWAEKLPVFVVDNSQPPLPTMESVLEWISPGVNLGIGAALNSACRAAAAQGFDWILTLDQDTKFSEAQWKEFLKEFQALPDPENVAVFAPTYNEHDPRRSERFMDVDLVMTSGNLLQLSVFRELGGFHEEMFIDEVDHEYCLRARAKGYRIVQTRNVLLIHVPGAMVTPRRAGLSYPHHNPKRLYTMVRNTLFLQRHYGRQFPAAIRGRLKALAFAVWRKLRYEPGKLATLRSVSRGVYDHLRRKIKEKSS